MLHFAREKIHATAEAVEPALLQLLSTGSATVAGMEQRDQVNEENGARGSG